MRRTILILAVALLFGSTVPAGIDSKIRLRFYEEFFAWKLYCQTEGAGDSDPTCNVHYRNMIAMGPKVAPLIMFEIEHGDGWQLESAFRAVTHRAFRRELDEGKCEVSSFTSLYIHWWYTGREDTGEQFLELYARWREYQRQGDSNAAHWCLYYIRDLGLLVLPWLVDEIEAGDTGLIPVVQWLTDKQVSIDQLTPDTIRDWWENNRDRWTLPSPDEP